MRVNWMLFVSLGMFFSTLCWSQNCVVEISRMDIHRGGVGAPETGPTEDINDNKYITWFHSFGTVVDDHCDPRGNHTVTYDTPLDNMCSTCGANAGYQLKIYSSQDPRVEKFDKPIVIVPGFDPDFGSTSSGNTFDNFKAMLSFVTDETKPGNVQVVGQNFLKELYDLGYDIIFIKFFNPNIDINVNAKVLEQAMLWVNSKSSTRSGDEPAILGASMGGLIARQMLQNAGVVQGSVGGPIKCGLYISFDVPNRGAEIPMSIQAMVRYLQSQNSDASILNINLASTSAGQMLLAQRTNSITSYAYHSITDYEAVGTVHGDFMRNINSPANIAAIKNIKALNNTRAIRTVAIASGSKNGSAALRGLPAGANYLSEDYATLYYRLGFSNANVATTLFTGNAADYSQWKYTFTEPAFLENLPGGNRNSYRQLNDILVRAGYGARNWTGQYNGHCFMPTASALGLTGIDINTPQGWLSSTGATMFDETYSAELNQDHVAITLQNKEWILSALRRYGPHANTLVSTVISPLLLQ